MLGHMPARLTMVVVLNFLSVNSSRARCTCVLQTPSSFEVDFVPFCQLHADPAPKRRTLAIGDDTVPSSRRQST